MRARFLVVAAIAIAVAALVVGRVASAPTDDPKISARAKESLERAQSGNYDRSQFTSEMNSVLTETLVANVKSALGPLGVPTAFTLRAHYDADGNSVYVYRATFKLASWNEQIAFAADGKISGLYFRPAPAPSETPLPGEDSSITARVHAEFLAWQHGQIDRSRYTTDASEAFSDSLVAKVATELTALGAPAAFIFRGKTAPPGGTIYAYRVSCANSDVWMTFGLDASGKINGIAFQPE
ncbi:MAG TPA: hypothetical protein VN905_04315 [Candidatus Binatia bacterium]|nr:hypothetical protein [Candidatus Binatia bacterium]